MTVHGDFSNSVAGGFAGVLYQQGRIFSDIDGTTETLITTDWQDTAARDTIGDHVAAVPASERDSFRIEAADLAAGAVTLRVHPGRVWADGLLVGLAEPVPAAAILRQATYLLPPIQGPAADESTIADGIRDAVVLEVWREAISAFQMPDLLLEPALGGPDTTERLNTAFALRLYRMAAGDTCDSLDLDDDFDAKGRLTATLQPTVAIGGDCPVIEGGGYTGLEHNLYRIEIADAPGPPLFKWSRFNGGLVGRALFDAVALRATITANLQAITSSGLESFYLEALRFDPDLGHWRVVYGANVTLDAEDRFVLPNAAGTTTGAIPGGPDDVFVRVWDGIRPLSQFPVSPNPNELEDGIRLEFQADATGRYSPGDYWTFSLRAGEIHNPNVLLAAEPPEGIHYHRVPLAELEWDGSDHLDVAEGTIDDCRVVFDPLTRIETCCTYHVGDGVHSHGDFTSIQAAIDALPRSGGEVCVLEGTFRENVVIERRVNMTVVGCGHRDRSRVVATDRAQPIFRVVDSRAVRIAGLTIDAHHDSQGILLDDATAAERGAEASGALRDVMLEDLHVRAAAEPAIETHGSLETTIRDCVVEMEDVATVKPAVFFQGDDGRIEANVVRVRNRRAVLSRQFDDTARANVTHGEWRAADLATWYQNLSAAKLPQVAALGFGGIQIGGLSDRVHIADNVIQGGTSNGITLGSLMLVREPDDAVGVGIVGWVLTPEDPCPPGDSTVPDDPGDNNPDQPGGRLASAGPLRDIYIERNYILDMGLNGIGVVGFFNLARRPALITVEHLTIRGNEIMRCLRRTIANIGDDMAGALGYGGISLAHVERLVVLGNLIRDNGPDYLTPVCGVYVLFGEGIQIDDNRIVDNGARTDDSTDGARPGSRAGVLVAAVMTPPEGFGVTTAKQLPMGEDVPALSLHDNLVSQPLGPALSATALGPVSVHANSLTSQGIVRQSTRGSFAGATVNILDLGLSGEQGGGRFFGAIAASILGGGPGAVNPAAGGLIIRPMFEFLRRGLVLPTGKVLFSDNQCQLDLVAERQRVIGIRQTAQAANMPAAAAVGWQVQLSVASISVLSLDDVGFHDNQCFTNLAFGILMTNALVVASSLRVAGNRFKEGPQDVVYSGATLGEINTTSHNQATHCLLIVPSTFPRGVSDGNIVVQTINNPDDCAQRSNILG